MTREHQVDKLYLLLKRRLRRLNKSSLYFSPLERKLCNNQEIRVMRRVLDLQFLKSWSPEDDSWDRVFY